MRGIISVQESPLFKDFVYPKSSLSSVYYYIYGLNFMLICSAGLNAQELYYFLNQDRTDIAKGIFNFISTDAHDFRES